MPTAEMPTDPLLDVGNIQPAVAEDASSAADSGAVYGALLVEEILTEAEVKNTPTIAAVMLKEVHDVRYWEDMELQDVRAVDAVPNLAAALIRRAMVRGLAMRGLIAKGCVEGVLEKALSAKWADVVAKAMDAPPCPSGDPATGCQGLRTYRAAMTGMDEGAGSMAQGVGS